METFHEPALLKEYLISDGVVSTSVPIFLWFRKLQVINKFHVLRRVKETKTGTCSEYRPKKHF